MSVTIPAADLGLGTFSDEPPWLVDPATTTWRIGLDRLRARTRAEIPELTRRRRVPPLGRLASTVRHLGVPVAVWAATDRRAGGATSRAGLSRRLRRAAETHGPTYVKLGQIISSGEGLFPEELVSEFKRCRDQVPAERWEAVEQVVTEELGRPITEVSVSYTHLTLPTKRIV